MTQRPAKLALTNYKLKDYATSLRLLADVARIAEYGSALPLLFSGVELEEIAEILEGQMYSPVQGS